MKKIHKSLLSILMIYFCIMNCNCQSNKNDGGSGDQKNDTFSTPDSAAQRAIGVLQALASNEKLKGAINLSADEVGRLTIGKAIAVQEVSYNDLLKTHPDSTPVVPPVDSASQRVWLYPLQLDNTIKTTTVVARTNGSWQLTTAGDNSHVEALNEQRPQGASIVSLIEVPGLRINFIKLRTNDGIYFRSDRSIPEVKIEKGQLIPERTALQLIASYARIIEDKYGKDIKNKKVVD